MGKGASETGRTVRPSTCFDGSGRGLIDVVVQVVRGPRDSVFRKGGAEASGGSIQLEFVSSEARLQETDRFTMWLVAEVTSLHRHKSCDLKL